jgi:hypothetical protein
MRLIKESMPIKKIYKTRSSNEKNQICQKIGTPDDFITNLVNTEKTYLKLLRTKIQNNCKTKVK